MLHNLKLLLATLLLSACSTSPSGPSVLVLQGTNKDYAQFHSDDSMCRNLARQEIVTLQIEPDSMDEGQQNYDIVYLQCMFGKGNRIPIPEDIIYGTLEEWDTPPPPNMPSPQ